MRNLIKKILFVEFHSNKIYVEFESELYSQFGLIKKMNQGWNDISELSVGIYYLYTNKTIYPLVKTDK